MQFIVLSSGHGTTFQATLDAIAQGELTASCAGLVTDRPDRGCIAKAEAHGIPYSVVEAEPRPDREAFDKAVHRSVMSLLDNDADDVLLAEMGWMWIHSPWFIDQWSDKILNVHPALLPKYGGKGMYGNHVHQAVLDAKETESGMTIHVMDSGVDTGPIIVQKNCTIEPGETVESVKAKVQELEKQWYPWALEQIHLGEIEL